MALNNLGWVCRRRGDLRGAETYYRKALSLNSEVQIARTNLALLRAEPVVPLDDERRPGRAIDEGGHVSGTSTGTGRVRLPAR